MRPLVEPFRRQHLGRRTGRDTPTLNLDRDAHQYLHRMVDRHRAEKERPRERNGALEKSDIALGESRRHVSLTLTCFCQWDVSRGPRFGPWRLTPPAASAPTAASARRRCRYARSSLAYRAC